MGFRVVMDGNAFYEIDEDCMKRRQEEGNQGETGQQKISESKRETRQQEISESKRETRQQETAEKRKVTGEKGAIQNGMEQKES
ncbi:MAG: hypothetical protein Q4C61_14025 [Lachnospiraceae bacterium]|nr:hypothetical protein [Lachnospiraceae bacterium]